MDLQDQISGKALKLEGGVFYLSEDRVSPEFEQAYHAIRLNEGRIYSDAELRGLPRIGKGHRHYGEWRIRENSAKKLQNYLAAQPSGLRILDLGCGNGWMSHRLSFLPEASIFGLDLNLAELRQAARVFKRPNLTFGYGNIFGPWTEGLKFDRIIISAAFQYFEDGPGLIRHLQTLLAPGGEIHVLDTPFYTATEVAAARQRTLDYYQQMGFPELAENYHHHTLASLTEFNFRVIYDPGDVFARFLRVFPWNYESPFMWVCVVN